MTDGVNNAEIATQQESSPQVTDKELNFRRLEAIRDQEREARIRAEMHAQAMHKELEAIKQMLQPKEADPLDDVEDYVDATRLKAKLEKERASFKKEAEEIARRTYEEKDREREQKNFLGRLKAEYRDFDEVMTESNLAQLEKTNPVFLKAVLAIPDDYERRKLAYEYLKNSRAPTEERASIKEKVEENARNPYYIPPTSGTPAAVEFDLHSKEARNQAYAKLKQWQRRPIGSSPAKS